MATTNLDIVIHAKDEAEKTVKKVKGHFNDLAGQVKKVGTGMTIAGGAIVGALGLSVKAFMESEVALAKVDTSLQSVSGSFDENRTKILEAATSAQKLIGVSDELAAVSFAKLAAATGDVNTALDLGKIAMDLSVISGRDLEAASQALILVQAGNTRVLKEFGIEIEENMTKEQAMTALREKLTGASEKYAETTEAQLKKMKESWGDLMEKIGAIVIPVLQKLIETIAPIIEKVMKWAEENPRLFATIITIIGVIGGLMAVLGPLLLLLPTLIAGFLALISPIGLVVTAIMVLIAVGVLIISYWEEFSLAIMMIWEQIKLWAIAIWDSFAKALMMIVDQITTWIRNAWRKLGENLLLIITQIKTWISDAWKALWEGLGAVVTYTFDGIKNAVKSSVNWVIGKINALITKINEATAKIAGFVGITAPVIPTIPSLAAGGIVSRPTLALIGEAGPEAVVPLTGRGMAGAGIGGITVNINGGYYLSEEAALDMGNTIIEVLKNQLRF